MRCPPKCWVPLALGCVAATGVHADELPVNLVRAEVNQDGRYEVFAVNSAGMLFHRWQMTGQERWARWVPNFLGKITDVDTAASPDGRMFALILDGGTLVVRAQQSANSGWASQSMRTGHDLTRIRVARNQDGRLEVFALGGDRRLYSISQASVTSELVESGWVTRTLEGTDLRDIAASHDGAGRIVVFALGYDGKAYYRRQQVPNGAFGPWSGLEGQKLERISAARQAAGSLTLFALGEDGALYSRTQVAPEEPWRAWTKVFDSPVKDWSATDSDSGLLEVAALWSPGIRLRVQTGDGSYFPWISTVQVPQTGRREVGPPGNVLEPFIMRDVPLRSISLRRGSDGGIRLFAINDSGAVYTLERPFDPKTSGTWDGHPWEWLGSPPISPNEPDVIAQMETCVERTFDAAQAAEINQIIIDLPRRIAQGGAGTPFQDLARNVSIETTCDPNGPVNWRQTIGVWLGRQPSPEVLAGQMVVDAGHSFAYRITADGLRRVFDRVWDLQPKTLNVEGHTIRLLSKDLQFVDNPLPAHDQLRLVVDGSASEAGQTLGLRATATATFSISDNWPLTAIDTPRPFCGLHVSLEGRGLAGDIAKAVLDIAGDLLDFKISTAEAKVLRVAQPMCQIKDAILSSTLLPRKDPAAPLKSLAINYDVMTVDGHGLTAYAVVPPSPALREPRVDWQVVDGSTKLTKYPWGTLYSFAVETITQDMASLDTYQWTYDYPLADATRTVIANVTDAEGNNLSGPSFTQPRLYMTYSVPNGVDWDLLQLGTLGVTARDSDGQTATASRSLK